MMHTCRSCTHEAARGYAPACPDGAPCLCLTHRPGDMCRPVLMGHTFTVNVIHTVKSDVAPERSLCPSLLLRELRVWVV
eukprot:6598726-Prymnesium_polylepis.1